MIGTPKSSLEAPRCSILKDKLVRIACASVGLSVGLLWYAQLSKGSRYESQAYDDLPLLLPLTRRHSVTSQRARVLQTAAQLQALKLAQPMQLAASDEPVEPSTAPLTNIGNTQYSVQIGIGTPPQQLNVLIDTGSSDLWMAPKKFNVAGSSTLKYSMDPRDQQRMINYGQGQVAGNMYFDNVVIGKARIEEQSFLTITDETESMHLVKTDGVLGLGPPLASNSGITVMEHLTEQRGISSFALLLCDYADGSTLVLGMPPDKWYIPKTLVYTPVVTDMWWGMDAALVVGGNDVEQGPFLLDSGTSFLSARRANYWEVVNKILPKNSLDSCTVKEKSLRVICPCSLKERLNPIAVRIGANKTFDIPKDLFFAPTVDGKVEDPCVLEVQPIADGSPLILGDTFLKGVVAMFDTDGPNGPRIGLAKRGPEAPICNDGLDLRRRLLKALILSLSAWLVLELCLFLHANYCPHRCLRLQHCFQKNLTQMQEPILLAPDAGSGAVSHVS